MSVLENCVTQVHCKRVPQLRKTVGFDDYRRKQKTERTAGKSSKQYETKKHVQKLAEGLEERRHERTSHIDIAAMILAYHRFSRLSNS